jgi:hypothetical protein
MSASPKTCPFLDLSSMDTTSPQCLDRGAGTSIYIYRRRGGVARSYNI